MGVIKKREGRAKETGHTAESTLKFPPPPGATDRVVTKHTASLEKNTQLAALAWKTGWIGSVISALAASWNNGLTVAKDAGYYWGSQKGKE